MFALTEVSAQPLYLIFVHGPDGQEIEINVKEISSIRQVKKTSTEYIHKDVKCLLSMTNGKFIGVVEECRIVVQKISKLTKPDQ